MVICHLPFGPTAYFGRSEGSRSGFWGFARAPKSEKSEMRGLSNVVLRHDLAEKPPTMSEARQQGSTCPGRIRFCTQANPHLIFHGFTAKMGLRVKTVLQAGFTGSGQSKHSERSKQREQSEQSLDEALFPPAKQAGDRVMTFANRSRLKLGTVPRRKSRGRDAHAERPRCDPLPAPHL